MNVIDVAKEFSTSEACNDFLESMRWPDGVQCLACQSKRVTKYAKQAGTRTRISSKTGNPELKAVPARILYVCLECGDQFSVTEETGGKFDKRRKRQRWDKEPVFGIV